LVDSYIIVYLDLVGYSKNKEPIQVSLFKKFQKEVHHLLYDEIVDENCILIPTGDGMIAGIENKNIETSYILSFELVVGMIDWTRRNECNVRSSIHVGDVNVLKDINRMKNIVGNTINDAARILMGANDGGIIISKTFNDKFLRTPDNQFGVKNNINADWSYCLNDEDIVIDKHSYEHNVYNIILTFKDIDYGSGEKILNKFYTNIYSTDYPKKQNLIESFLLKVKDSSELDFIGIYNPSLPETLKKIDFTNNRSIDVTILYAADSLKNEVKDFFGADDGNLDWVKKQKSFNDIVDWHKNHEHKHLIRINIFEYIKFLPFGASLLDKGISGKGFIHISHYIPKVIPAVTPYIEAEWKTNLKSPIYGYYHKYLTELLNGRHQDLKVLYK